MPAAATDNWEAVKATAIALNSIKRAADKHGVTYKSAKMRASREKWPVGQRPAKAAREAQQVAHTQLIKVSPGAVTAVTSTSDALANTLKERLERSKLGLSGWLAESSGHLESLKGEDALAAHQAAVNVASVMGKVYPEQAGEDRVSLQFFAITMNQAEPEPERPAIDV